MVPSFPQRENASRMFGTSSRFSPRAVTVQTLPLCDTPPLEEAAARAVEHIVRGTSFLSQYILFAEARTQLV